MNTNSAVVRLEDNTELQLEEVESTGVHYVVIEGRLWYKASDICQSLELTSYRDVVRRNVTPENKRAWKASTPQGFQAVLFINEEGIKQVLNRKTKAGKAPLEPFTAEDMQGIQTVYDYKGCIWYKAGAVCQKLGYRNQTEVLEQHVSPQNINRLVFGETGRKLLAINSAGVQELKTARKQGLIKKTLVTLIGITPASKSKLKDPIEEKPISYYDWKWIPAHTSNTQARSKLIGDRVAIHFTHGSNALLKGAGLTHIPASEFRQVAPIEDVAQAFNPEGFLVNYPNEWAEKFENNPVAQRIPAQHQLTLDLLMSDYIKSRRVYISRGKDEPKELTLQQWQDNPQFTTVFMEWYGAFHYTIRPNRPQVGTPERVTCKAWLGKITNSLCYLMRTGIIRPVETEEEFAYTYHFQFNKDWIQRIQSATLPAPVRVPPAIGRATLRGPASTSYKYTCNRLLSTAVLNPQNELFRRTQGIFSTTLKQYCYITGLPLFEDWIGATTYASERKGRYMSSMVQNPLETYSMFQFIRMDWGTAGAKRLWNKPAKPAIIWFKPLYQF